MRFSGNQESSRRPKTTCVVIYNPHAGKLKSRGSDRLERAVSILTEAGYEATLVPTSGPGAAVALARDWAAAQAMDAKRPQRAVLPLDSGFETDSLAVI